MKAFPWQTLIIVALFTCGLSLFATDQAADSNTNVSSTETVQNEATDPAVKASAERKLRLAINTPESNRLVREIENGEIEAIHLAKEIRTQTASTAAQSVLDDLRTQLETRLAKTFELKSELEKLRLQELQSRLGHLQHQLEHRQSQRTQIIQRRLRELTEGEETQWETDSAPRVQVDGANTSRKAWDWESTTRQWKPAGEKPAEITNVHFEKPSIDACLEFGGRLLNLPIKYGFRRDPDGVRSNSLRLISTAEVKALAAIKLDIYPSSAQTQNFFVMNNTVPVQMTGEDLNQVAAGNRVVKVAYQPKPDVRMQQWQVETLVSTRLEPGLDPVAIAKKRGTVLLVLSLSQPTADDDNAVQQVFGRSVKNVEVRNNAGELSDDNVLSLQTEETNAIERHIVATTVVRADSLVELDNARTAREEAQNRIDSMALRPDRSDRRIFAEAEKQLIAATSRFEMLKDKYQAEVRDTAIQIQLAKAELEALRYPDGSMHIAQYELRKKKAALELERIELRYAYLCSAGEKLGVVDSKGEKPTKSEKPINRDHYKEGSKDQ